MASKHDKNIKITVTDNGKLKQTTKDIDNLNKSQQRHNKSSQTLDRNLKGNAAMSANASKNFSKQAQSMQGVLVPAYAEVAARVFALTAAYTALERAADYGILQKGQAAFAASTGKNMAQIARDLQKASGYMLDFQAASQSTALASTAGLTAKQIERMTKGARAASVALGRNMTDSMDRLTRGIVKAEPEILDELGVIIRLDKVYKDFAESVNKTTSELTEMEKLTARNTAIMEQLEGKFGDIAETIPANAFAQLSSSVLDLVKQGGALFANFFNPLVSVLSESKILLSSIMLLIGRNLISKVFPFFDGMGEKLKKFSDRMATFKTRMHDLSDSIVKKSAGKTLIALRDNDVRDATAQLKKMGVEGGTLGGKAFAKAIAKEGSVGAALLGKNVIANIRKSITMGRKDILKYGPVMPDATATTAGMAGQTLQDMDKLSSTLDKVSNSMNQVAQATKGTMSVGAVSFFGRLGKAAATAGENVAGAASNFLTGSLSARQMGLEFGRAKTFFAVLKGSILKGSLDIGDSISKADAKLHTMVNTMSRAAKAGHLLASTLQGISRALTAVVGIMSAVMMVKWIGQEFLGMSKAISTAHEALDSMNDSLQETSDILTKSFSKKLDIGTSVEEAISSKTFVANVAEGIFTSLDAASAALEVENLDRAWVGRWVDSIFEVFGAGIQSKLQESISKALIGLAGSMDAKQFSKLLDTVDIQGAIAGQFERGKREAVTDKALLAIGASGLSVAAALGVAFAPVTLTVLAVSSAVFGLVNAFDALSTSFVDVDKEAASVVDTLNQVNKGILSPELALERLEDKFDTLNLTRNELIQTYINISEASKTFAEETKKEEQAIKGLQESVDSLLKTRKAFSASLVKGGELKDFSDSFKSVLRDLINPLNNASEKFGVLMSAGLAGAIEIPKEQKTQWLGWEKAVKAINLEIAKTKMNIADLSPEEIADRVRVLETGKFKVQQLLAGSKGDLYKNKINNIKRELLLEEENKKLSEDKLHNKAQEVYLSKLLNGNVTKQYELELTLATKLQVLANKRAHLNQFDTSAIKERAKVEQDILRLEKEKLEGRIALGQLTDAELANANAQLVNLNVQIALAGRTAVSLSKHFHDIAGTTETISDQIAAMSKQSGAQDSVFNNWRLDLINKEFNIIKNSVDETFVDTQKLIYVMDVLKNKFGKDVFNTSEGKKLLKQWQLAFTKQGKIIKDRNRTITEEVQLISVQTNHWTQHEDLIAAREKMAKMDLEVSDKLLQKDKERLKLRELYLVLAKQEADLKIARFEEATQQWADAIKSVSEAFDSTISSFISDKLMGKETDVDWRTVIAQSLSDSAGSIISGMATKFTFGNEGMLAKAGKNWFGIDQHTIDAIFPKTDVQVLEGSIAAVERAIKDQRAILEATKDYTGTMASSVNNGAINTTESTEGLKKLSDSIAKVKVTAEATVDVDKLSNSINEGLKPIISNIDASIKSISEKVGGFTPSKQEIELYRNVYPPMEGESEQDYLERYKKNVQDYMDKSSSMYNITPANMTAGLTSDVDYTNMDWAQKQIHGGISPSVDKTLKEIQNQVTQSQQFLDNMAVKTLDSIDTMVSFDIGIPLEDAAQSLNDFMDFVDGEFSPTIAKLGPVLDNINPLIGELTKTVRSLNEFFGVTNSGKEGGGLFDWSNADGNLDKISKALLSKRDISAETYAMSSVAMAGSSGDPINDKIIKDIISKKNIKKYAENQKFLKDIGDFKWGVNKDKFKPWHPNASSPSQGYNRTLPGIQHKDSFARAQAKGISLDFKKYGAKNIGVQQRLPFTGPGIPTNSAVTSSSITSKLLPAVEKLSVVLMGLMPKDLAVDPMAKPYKKQEAVDPNYPLGSYGPTASELQEGNVLEMFWNMGVRIADKINEALGITDPTGSIEKLKVPQKFNFTDPYSVENNPGIKEKLERIVSNTTPSDLQLAALTAQANVGKDGAAKVDIVNPEDIKTTNMKVQGPDGGYVPSVAPSTDNAIDTMSRDIRYSMASNLNTQIMNDNLNAKSLLGNAVSSAASNMMSTAIMGMFGFANGGIAPGGFRAFANGGTVSQPTLGLVGEGKYNEAVVPLPDGKSIPVIGSTGGDNNVTVNVTVDSNGNAKSETQSGMDGDQAKQLGYMISQAVQSELVEQQRPGGLLSQY